MRYGKYRPRRPSRQREGGRGMRDRSAIKVMFGGRCAYCGKLLGNKWHADHVAPIYRGWGDKPAHAGKDNRGNLFPACPRCNLRKSALSLEDFRHEIAAQVYRLRRYSAAFRLAEDFGLIAETGNLVGFFFETPITSLADSEKGES